MSFQVTEGFTVDESRRYIGQRLCKRTEYNTQPNTCQ